jgi:membrane protein implicated in regulation of membrane protease activity
VLVVIAALCLYAGIFFAWLVQTPVQVSVRDQANALLNLWTAGFFVSILLIVLMGAKARSVWRIRKRS